MNKTSSLLSPQTQPQEKQKQTYANTQKQRMEAQTLENSALRIRAGSSPSVQLRKPIQVQALSQSPTDVLPRNQAACVVKPADIDLAVPKCDIAQDVGDEFLTLPGIGLLLGSSYGGLKYIFFHIFINISTILNQQKVTIELISRYFC